MACPSCGAKVATGAAATPPAAPPAAPVGRPVPSSHAKDLALLGLSHEASVPEVKMLRERHLGGGAWRNEGHGKCRHWRFSSSRDPD